MKTHLTLLASLLVSITLQAQTYEWSKSFGSLNYTDEGRSIAVDALGNVYTTGSFWGVVDFDPGAGTAFRSAVAGRDIYVQKLNASGNLVWVHTFGAVENDDGLSIAVDASGNVYISGYFNATIDFNPGPGVANLTSTGLGSVFVLKLAPSGNYLWAKSFGGSGSAFTVANSMTVDTSGNVFTTGSFQGTVDFDPGAGAANHVSEGLGSRVFVQKLDASGNFIWAKSFGNSFDASGQSIKVDISGNVYTTGFFSSILDFNPGVGTAYLISAGNNDIFVQKLDSSGSFIWAKGFGGSFEDIGYSIDVDAAGNVYTTGSFRTTVDFDPGTGIANRTSAGAEDIYVQKLDASGNFLWVQTFGSNASDESTSITLDADRNVYTTGFFKRTVDFNPGTGIANRTSAGEEDVFIQKLDSSGNFLWVQTFGGNQTDYCESIFVDDSENIYTIGSFYGTADFNPGPGTANHTSAGIGWGDVFVQKLSKCYTDTGTVVVNACGAFKWINGVNYTESNNTATHTLVNAAGCDSVVTLNLTINKVTDLSTSTSGFIITANNTGATYQWLDCNNSYAVIPGETAQTFTATANGNFAVKLTENGCVDTSLCVAITTVGMLENSFSQTFNIFPNPTTGTFAIHLGSQYESVQVTIRDLLGRIIHVSNYASTSGMQISVDEPIGIYFIQIDSGEVKAKLKLVKE